jgi:hypothetical protein
MNDDTPEGITALANVIIYDADQDGHWSNAVTLAREVLRLQTAVKSLFSTLQSSVEAENKAGEELAISHLQDHCNEAGQCIAAAIAARREGRGMNDT